jgi:abequosyltransferase
MKVTPAADALNPSPTVVSKSVKTTLSICIATFNRAHTIGATLDSIVPQLTDEVELLVLDGASTDSTEEVVTELARRCEQLRYVKLPQNNGLDRDFDTCVSLARGQYCWLMSSDDFLKPGAIRRVLTALNGNLSLIIVNAEHRDESMSRVVIPSRLSFSGDRTYDSDELESLFVDAGTAAGYIGSVVIEREIWLTRERVQYYGLLVIHEAVIFQKKLPGRALVIAEALVAIRGGHPSWMAKLPDLAVRWWPFIASLPVSEAAKRRRRKFMLPSLMLSRAMGGYSLAQYHQWIRPTLHSISEALLHVAIALAPPKAMKWVLALQTRTR